MKKRELTENERWRIIGFLDKDPNYSECAKIYGISKSTAWNIKKKFTETGDVKDLPRTGQPSLAAEKIEKIVEEIKNDGASLRKIAGINEVSHTTIINYAHKAKLNFRRYEEIPILTENHKRLEFCEKYKSSFFRDWIFVDESYFHLFRNTMGAWTAETHIYVERKNPNPALMVWGGVSKQGKTPICIEEYGITQQEYKKILKEKLVPYSEIMFSDGLYTVLQDNARPHIGSLVTKWMTKHIPIIENLPPYSPELNPIEHIWAIMKTEVEKMHPANLDELKKSINLAWNNITQEIINNCIDHIHSEIANKGEYSN